MWNCWPVKLRSAHILYFIPHLSLNPFNTDPWNKVHYIQLVCKYSSPSNRLRASFWCIGTEMHFLGVQVWYKSKNQYMCNKLHYIRLLVSPAGIPLGLHPLWILQLKQLVEYVVFNYMGSGSCSNTCLAWNLCILDMILFCQLIEANFHYFKSSY